MLADHRVKLKENEKRPGPCQRTKNAMERKGDDDTNCNWYLRTWK